MTVEVDGDTTRAALRALIIFTENALPDYATDPVVQDRVGRMLADSAARVRLRSNGIDW
jgi:hypothetical protein